MKRAPKGLGKDARHPRRHYVVREVIEYTVLAKDEEDAIQIITDDEHRDNRPLEVVDRTAYPVKPTVEKKLGDPALFIKAHDAVFAYAQKEATYGNSVHRLTLAQVAKKHGATAVQTRAILKLLTANPREKAKYGQLWYSGQGYYELAVEGVSAREHWDAGV